MIGGLNLSFLLMDIREAHLMITVGELF